MPFPNRFSACFLTSCSSRPPPCTAAEVWPSGHFSAPSAWNHRRPLLSCLSPRPAARACLRGDGGGAGSSALHLSSLPFSPLLGGWLLTWKTQNQCEHKCRLEPAGSLSLMAVSCSGLLLVRGREQGFLRGLRLRLTAQAFHPGDGAARREPLWPRQGGCAPRPGWARLRCVRTEPSSLLPALGFPREVQPCTSQPSRLPRGEATELMTSAASQLCQGQGHLPIPV